MTEPTTLAAPDEPATPPTGSEAAPAPRPPRRFLRAVARWTAAAVLCGGLWGGVGYALTVPDRGDLPGLGTEDDGRWQYPELSLPALPERVPLPFSASNAGEVHHADLRELLLPAPRAAKELDGLDGGWVATKEFTSLFSKKEDREKLDQRLTDMAVRHVAARGWTMPDGTESRVYLLRFNSAAFASAFKDELIGFQNLDITLRNAHYSRYDSRWPPELELKNLELDVMNEDEPYGKVHVRHATVLAGDTLGLVVHSRKGEAAAVPFHQTVILQAQLLG
ncbi:hypothetical protein [Streptomyces alkaliterrae]|uniref:Uncharacterized protein n=1 Tax=Streptomyces alkaliterrae TaxID=2213162 RepID=A0A5P0YSS5_9ACTN|nr:hypothetical protein [Streptomyces alkaliterrae]MBB1257592.1 hypothetical protein [Streptomyces alkaliterrae]MQS03374.1 hypothetical protein [Streptomyces alkaliterrae]